MSDNIDKPQGGEADKPQGGENGASQGDAKPTMSLAEAMAKIVDLEKDNFTYRKTQRTTEAANKAAEEKRLAEQAEWQKLAQTYKADLDKLAPIAEQHEAITAAFNASLDNRLKQIPDDVRKKTVNPVRTTMTPVAFSNWLDANLDILRSRQAPPLDGGAGASRPAPSGETLTATDIEMAKAMNIKPEDWAKRKAEVAAIRANPKKE